MNRHSEVKLRAKTHQEVRKRVKPALAHKVMNETGFVDNQVSLHFLSQRPLPSATASRPPPPQFRAPYVKERTPTASSSSAFQFCPSVFPTPTNSALTSSKSSEPVLGEAFQHRQTQLVNRMLCLLRQKAYCVGLTENVLKLTPDS